MPWHPGLPPGVNVAVSDVQSSFWRDVGRACHAVRRIGRRAMRHRSGKLTDWRRDLAAVPLRAFMLDLGLVATILPVLWTSLGAHLLHKRSRAFHDAE